jgi:hypothetical protein
MTGASAAATSSMSAGGMVGVTMAPNPRRVRLDWVLPTHNGLLYTDNVVSRGRHPKKQISDALTAVARPGLEVHEIHKGHRWGALTCTTCKASLPIWSTPRVPEDTAKNIRRFDLKHRHEEDQ